MLEEIAEKLRARLHELSKGEWKTAVRMVDIRLIYPNPYHTPPTLDQAEIVRWIHAYKKEGILTPITVSVIGDANDPKFQIISGEKTYQICVCGGISPVPCVILDRNEERLRHIGDVSFADKSIEKSSFSRDLSRKFSSNTAIRAAFSRENISLLEIDIKNRTLILQADLSEETLATIEALPPRIKEEIYRAIRNGAPAPQERANVRPCIKDTRFFFNSVSKAVKTMNESGISIECSREEQRDATKLTILVPKQPSNAECSTWNTRKNAK